MPVSAWSGRSRRERYLLHLYLLEGEVQEGDASPSWSRSDRFLNRTGNMGQSPARQTGPALEAMFRFMLGLVPAVEKFPRSFRAPTPPSIRPTEFNRSGYKMHSP